MDLDIEILNYKVYARTTPFSAFSSGYGFVLNNNAVSQNPPNDFYVPVLLNRTSKAYEYVDVQDDNQVFFVERQEFNPYFIELGFFDTIKEIYISGASDLNQPMINAITAQTSSYIGLQYDFNTWFNDVEMNYLSSSSADTGNASSITLESLSLLNDVNINSNLISKANKYPIKIQE